MAQGDFVFALPCGCISKKLTSQSVVQMSDHDSCCCQFLLIPVFVDTSFRLGVKILFSFQRLS